MCFHILFYVCLWGGTGWGRDSSRTARDIASVLAALGADFWKPGVRRTHKHICPGKQKNIYIYVFLALFGHCGYGVVLLKSVAILAQARSLFANLHSVMLPAGSGSGDTSGMRSGQNAINLTRPALPGPRARAPPVPGGLPDLVWPRTVQLKARIGHAPKSRSVLVPHFCMLDSGSCS